METLHELFENMLEDTITFSDVWVKLIKRGFEKKGVTLSETQLLEIRQKLEVVSGNLINIDFDLDDLQKNILGTSSSETVEIDFGEIKELDEVYHELFKEKKISVSVIVEEMASQIFSSLIKDIPTTVRAHRKDINSFERRLQMDWGKPFELFEAFLILAFEAGNEINNEFRKDRTKEDTYVRVALTRLHARACQIAFEILVLLKSGFADGAHSRWRSLHEIAVVAFFIKTQGNEVAERYLLHDHIESFRIITLHKEYYKELGDEPISQEKHDSIKAGRDALLKRFGNAYNNNYGWAASALQKDNPSFRDIQKKTGLDYLHPYYKLASHNIHANPKGIMFRIGVLGNTRDILLAGPSNYGFTDPAQCTAYSLRLVTDTLLAQKPSVDNLVLSNVLLKFETEIKKEFFKIQKEIENNITI